MEELGINQAFLAAKKTAFDATKTTTKPDGDVLDPEYVKELANYTKIKNKAVRALHKTAKAEKETTEHNAAIDALDLRAKSYSKLRKFDNMKVAKEALRAKYDDWQTAAYGMRGASPTDNFHGRVDGAGCFHIKSVDRKSKGLGVTYIYGADDNEEQPEFSDGEAPSDGEDGGGNEGASSRIRRAFTRMTTHARARPRIHAHGHAFTHTHACFMHSRACPRSCREGRHRRDDWPPGGQDVRRAQPAGDELRDEEVHGEARQVEKPQSREGQRVLRRV